MLDWRLVEGAVMLVGLFVMIGWFGHLVNGLGWVGVDVVLFGGCL